ncbi:MAG TPA: PilZ domain-containing protein [Elusimicrobiota bacterium]|jgi:hypothetical protein|nr:PilZ domain-containing protein [Elusimicrobiota bacterium]
MASADDRRRHLRVYHAVPFTLARATGVKVSARSIDVSLGGIRFASDGPLDPGERVSGELLFPNGSTFRISGLILPSSSPSQGRYQMAFDDETTQRLLDGFLGL